MRFILAFIFLFSQIAWSQTTGKNIEFNSVTGADYFTNYILQPSAKKNASNTTTSSATVAKDTTNKIDNVASYSVDASAQNGYVDFTLGTVYDPATSGNCEFKGVFKGDGSLYKAQIVDGSGNLLNQTMVLTNETNWRPFSVTYPCAASGSRKVRITQTEAGTAPAFSVGKLYYGQITNLQAGVPNNVFSARIIATGTVSGENEDFINGDCTVSDTSLYTCSFISNKFSLKPTCSAFGENTGDGGASPQIAYNTSITTSSIIVRTSTASAKQVVNFGIICTRSGADFIQPAITPAIPSAPTVQKFTSGSGTYTTPVGVKYIRVRMVGGGGGGGSGGTSSWGAATAGGNTTFGTSLLVANGGTQGTQSSNAAGGTVTVNAPAVSLNSSQGAYGGGISYNGTANAQISAGYGGNTPFGGGGGSGAAGGNGISGIANTGAGGGGGGTSVASGNYSGGGGGAGGYIEAFITSPSSSYAYTVGAGGTGGSAGANGFAGGAGGSGYIEVTEYYGSENAPMLVGSVTDNNSSAGFLPSATITNNGSACSVTSSDTGFLSGGTRNGAGDCSFTVATYSASPRCWCNLSGSAPAATGRSCMVSSTGRSATALRVVTYVNNAAADADAEVFCKGPR